MLRVAEFDELQLLECLSKREIEKTKEQIHFHELYNYFKEKTMNINYNYNHTFFPSHSCLSRL